MDITNKLNDDTIVSSDLEKFDTLYMKWQLYHIQYTSSELDDLRTTEADVMEEIEETATPVTCVNTKRNFEVTQSDLFCFQTSWIKCHHSNFSGTYKLNFETCGCCLLIQGLCDNSHSFCWTSSDIVHSFSGKKVYSDNLNFASATVLSGNSYNKLSYSLISLIQSVFPEQHFSHTSGYLFVHPLKNFIRRNRNVYRWTWEQSCTI